MRARGLYVTARRSSELFDVHCDFFIFYQSCMCFPGYVTNYHFRTVPRPPNSPVKIINLLTHSSGIIIFPQFCFTDSIFEHITIFLVIYSIDMVQFLIVFGIAMEEHIMLQ